MSKYLGSIIIHLLTRPSSFGGMKTTAAIQTNWNIAPKNKPYLKSSSMISAIVIVDALHEATCSCQLKSIYFRIQSILWKTYRNESLLNNLSIKTGWKILNNLNFF